MKVATGALIAAATATAAAWEPERAAVVAPPWSLGAIRVALVLAVVAVLFHGAKCHLNLQLPVPQKSPWNLFATNALDDACRRP